MTAPVPLERGPFSIDKYTLDATTSNDSPNDRKFNLSTRTQIDPSINEILEVYVEGVKLKGSGGTTTAGGGDEFYVNSLTAPTILTIVPNATLAALTTDNTDNASSISSLGNGDLLVIKRISNRSTKNVDYAPGSVIREVDLDSSNTQILHTAQEAMDIAIESIGLDTDDEWEASSKEIKNVAAGTDALDAVNYTQLTAHDTTITGYMQNAEDYKNTAISYATKVDGFSQTYSSDTPSNTSDHSSKAWAVGGTGVTTTSSKGASKEWATATGLVDTANYSSKTYSQSATAGTNTYGGSAKGWASTAYGAAVPGAASTARSALHYSTDASNSATAAKNSANAVANTFDAFDDVYLGKMSDTSTQGTNPTPTGEWEKDSSTITVSANTNIKVGQVVTGHSSIPAGANVLSIDGTAIVISASMTAASPGSDPTLTFTGYGVYGTYNGTKDGPTTDNDNGALADGMLYFNTTDNNMMVYKETGAAWIPATSSGGVSLVMHKAVASGTPTSFAASDFTPTLSYEINNIVVFLNGVRLDATDYTATTGTTITGLAALANGDEMTILAFKTFEVGDAVSAASGGTFNANVSFGDNNITNVGDIALDTITADGSSIVINDDTSFGDNNITNVGSIALDSIVADGTSITLSSDTALSAGKDLETSTTGKIIQRGAFMQSSTHQALFLGY